MDLSFLGLGVVGLKSLTFYAAVALYAAALVYGLVLLMMMAPKGGFKTGRGERALKKKKPSTYSMDDILEMSAAADAYELAQEPYTAQYIADLCAQIASQYELSPEDQESLR